MTWAKGHYDSVYGRIISQWKQSGEDYIYNITVPANTTATLYLLGNEDNSVMESGIPAKKAGGMSFVRLDMKAAGRYMS